MSKEDVIPWWRGQLDKKQRVSAFFAKVLSKLTNRIAEMFPDHVRDIYYSAGRMAGVEAQKEYFQIGKRKPPGHLKGVIEFIKTALERLVIPFGDIKIGKLQIKWQDEEAILEIKDNPYTTLHESEEPFCCYFLRGFIEAILEYASELDTAEYENLVVEEETCMSLGSKTCTFKITRVSSRIYA
jgi:predicted hydrocarbon binding protein